MEYIILPVIVASFLLLGASSYNSWKALMGVFNYVRMIMRSVQGLDVFPNPTLFISFSASSNQMVCNSNLFKLSFDVHSGYGILRSGHGCHESTKNLHCDRHYDQSWTCHDACQGTKIRIKKTCHEHMDNDW